MSKQKAWIRIAVVALMVLSLSLPLSATASLLRVGDVAEVGSWWVVAYVYVLQYFAGDSISLKSGQGMDPNGAPGATLQSGQGGEAGMGMDPDGVNGSASAAGSTSGSGATALPQS